MTRSIFLAVLLLGCGPDKIQATGTASTGAPTGTATGSTTTGDTWDNFAGDFMQTYCVECHETSPKDFTKKADVVAFADRVRCGTASSTLSDCTSPPARQFPIGTGPMPTDDERDRLVAWIDAGTP